MSDKKQAKPAQLDHAPNELPPVQSFWGFFYPMIKPYKWLVGGSLFLNALHGVAVTFQTLTPKYLVDDVLLAPNLDYATRVRRLFWLAGWYLFASIFARMTLWHIGYRMFTFVREKVLFTMRANFFRHVNHLCLRFHIKHNSGELFSYLFGSPLGQIQNYFQQFTFGAPGALFILVTTIIWLGAWDWMMTTVLLTMVSLTVVIMHRSRKVVQELHSDFQKTESNVSGYVADLLRGSRDVKLYAMEDKVSEDFEERVWEIGQKSYRRDVQSHVQWMKNETVQYCSFAALCIVAGFRYLYDQSHRPPEVRLTIGEIQAYLTAFMSMQGAMSQLFNLSTIKGAAQAGVDRINAVLRAESTTPDPASEAQMIPRKGDIELRGVHFAYEAARPVLKGLNLHVPYGQRVALVGPSGAGKSTVTQMLLRLYDPDQGSVLIGGMNVRLYQGADLRQHFGVVPQDPFIFRTTIRYNLCVARPDATIAQMRRACELANAWEFIERLPSGFDTPVGEGGSTLSGGQRQRLAIARALLAEPDYFIFDEATSALDTLSEKLVQDAMTRSTGGRTTFIIAHRLATVKDADRILVVDGGIIAQDGTYDDLVKQPGVFRDLVQGQVLRS